MTATTTSLKMPEILDLRIEAAKRRVAQWKWEVRAASIKVELAAEQGVLFQRRIDVARQELAKAQEALDAAEPALAKAELEGKVWCERHVAGSKYQELPDEAAAVRYDAASSFELTRCAALLLERDGDLEPAKALRLVREADGIRFEHYMATYVEGVEEDEDEN